MENCNTCTHKDVCAHREHMNALNIRIKGLFEREPVFDIFQTKIYCKFYSDGKSPLFSKRDSEPKPPVIKLDNAKTSKNDAMIERILNKMRRGESLNDEERSFGVQMINDGEPKSPSVNPDILPPASRLSDKDTSENNKKRFGPSYVIGDMSPSDVRKIN